MACTGQVTVADGTDEAAGALERVLTNDPGMGIARHADAGYEDAIQNAKERGVDLLVKDRGWVRSVAETLETLASRNGCEGFEETRLPDAVKDDGSTVLLRSYLGCSEPLKHYVIEGGGHTWPGSRRSGIARALIGETNQDISATRVVEDFFKGLDRE